MTDLGPAAGWVHDPAVVVAELRDAVEAYIREHAVSKTALAERAGMTRQHLDKFLANGGREGYRLEVPTAERLAAAIGMRLTLGRSRGGSGPP